MEFMQAVTNKYEDCIVLNKNSEFLQYSEIFDAKKFVKSNSGLKAKEFYN